jgi:hypothetical protein
MKAKVLQLVTDNTAVGRARPSASGRARRWQRWREAILGYHCPSCHRLAGQPCTMAHPIRVHRDLYRDFHLTRADEAYRALRDR